MEKRKHLVPAGQRHGIFRSLALESTRRDSGLDREAVQCPA